MQSFRFNLAAFASLVLTAGPGVVHAGYYYEAVTTNGGPGSGGSEVSTVHAWVDGDSANVEFQQSAQAGMFQAGSYIVT